MTSASFAHFLAMTVALSSTVDLPRRSALNGGRVRGSDRTRKRRKARERKAAR